jgi:hypothetical protein
MRFGAFLRSAFGTHNQESAQTVKDWARAVLDAPAETAFAVNEIACTDPSCPGVETIILVMEPGRKTRAHKIQKALDEVTQQDVRDALEP